MHCRIPSVAAIPLLTGSSMIAYGSRCRPAGGGARGKRIFAKALPVPGCHSHITVEGFDDGEDSRRHVTGSAFAMEFFVSALPVSDGRCHITIEEFEGGNGPSNRLTGELFGMEIFRGCFAGF